MIVVNLWRLKYHFLLYVHVYVYLVYTAAARSFPIYLFWSPEVIRFHWNRENASTGWTLFEQS